MPITVIRREPYYYWTPAFSPALFGDGVLTGTGTLVATAYIACRVTGDRAHQNG